MGSPKELIVSRSYDDLKLRLKQLLEESFSNFKAASTNSKRYSIAVSGASMINILSDVFPSLTSLSSEDWKSWLIFLVDERLVSFDNPGSSFGSYNSTLLPKCPLLSVEQFVPIDPTLDAEACAADYELRMKTLLDDVNPEVCSFPRLNMVLLGFGPDGHTASLFPGHALLDEKTKWIASITDSPKPPSTRVTFTLPLIEAAHSVVVVSTGSSKAEVVRRVFEEDDQSLPVNLIKSPFLDREKVVWLIDSDAAGLLRLEDDAVDV